MTHKSTNYWFKRRRYGWGWTPVTWQGWFCVILAAVVLLIALFEFLIGGSPSGPSPIQLAIFFVTILLDVTWLTFVAYAKGPEPHWRSGKKPSDDPHEDF